MTTSSPVSSTLLRGVSFGGRLAAGAPADADAQRIGGLREATAKKPWGAGPGTPSGPSVERPGPRDPEPTSGP